MTEMVERVARELCDKSEFGNWFWDVLDESTREAWRKAARIAIAAMREPTDDMIKKGISTALISYCDADPIANFPDEEVKIWRAMIDAALKEDEA